MDYEKKYKEALEKARQLCAYPTSKPFINDLQDLFPELKESEGEKIRKEIIDFVKSRGGFKGDWIAWLEKQGEQKPADKSKIKPKFKTGDRVIGVVSGMPYFITEVCGDYYNTESGCIIMFNAQDNFELVEQKPILDVEIPFGTDSELVEEAITIPDGCYAIIEDNKVILRKGEKKPSWSEEDENMRGNLLGYLNGFSVSETDKHQMFDWLKFLRPQNTWKPSDKQIEAVRIAIGDEQGSDCCDILRSLLKDLKSL